LAAGAVAAIALTGGGSPRGGDARSTTTSASNGTSSTSRSHTTSTHAARSATASTASTASTPAASTASTPSTTAAASGDPKQLNDRGFALIQQGDNAGAVPVLQGSVQGFRSQGRTGELDYAFALYNLATALRATGHPADAIPLLQERLRISSYKRDVVQQELARARAQAGQPAAAGTSASGAAGKAPKPGKAPKAGKGNRGHGGGEGDGGDGGDN
jgi:serine/threonine-protein kinase